MILKALYDYYERSKVKLPAFGLELKEIGIVIVIDKEGRFIRIEDKRIDAKHAQQFLVKKSVGRSSAPVANFLYDNSKYVLGFSDKGDIGACKKYYQVFKDKVKSIYETQPKNTCLKALMGFYSVEQEKMLAEIQTDPLWEEVVKNLSKKYSIFSFLVLGDTQIVAAKEELLNLMEEKSDGTGSICLITGVVGKSVETTTATMIPGSQATAKLVSFQVRSGYDSYGKEKGGNAPIGEEAEFAYTTALNHMLASDSRNKFLIGSRTFLFWASKSDEVGQQAEESLFYMFNEDKIDDPNKGILQVRKVFSSIYSGVLKTSVDDKFYILGLAPNSARIAVVYWAELSLYDFAGRISRHFSDMEICGGNKPYMGLRSMLSAVTLGGKSSEATPNLPDAIVKSIFEGTPYPYTLMAECIRRIRVEQSIYTARAAILKAYLNRLNNNEQKIEVMLDKENKNQGYLCGRLFAVLDKIQEEANNQHSIRERYMNAASATPATVFATILNLSSHHSENLSEGRKINFEKLKQEIIEKISADGFPAHLDLQDQGRFFVGYYHQRQDFFVSKSEKDNNNN